MSDNTDDSSEKSENNNENEQKTPETGAVTRRPEDLRQDVSAEQGAHDDEEDTEDDG